MKRFKEQKAKESHRAYLARRRRENREMAEMHARVAADRRSKREAAMREREMEIENIRIRKREEARARRRARAKERMLARQRERHTLPSPLPSQYASDSDVSFDSFSGSEMASPVMTPANAQYVMDGVVMSPSVSPGSMVGELELYIPEPSSAQPTLSPASTPFDPATKRVFRKHAHSPPEERTSQSVGVQTLPTVIKKKADYMPYRTQKAIENVHRHVEQSGIFYKNASSEAFLKPQSVQMPSLSPPKKRRESYAAPNVEGGGAATAKSGGRRVELSAKPSSPEEGASRDPYLELVVEDAQSGSSSAENSSRQVAPLFGTRAAERRAARHAQVPSYGEQGAFGGPHERKERRQQYR